METGLIVGLCFGVIVAVILLGIFAYCFCCKRHQHVSSPTNRYNTTNNQYTPTRPQFSYGHVTVQSAGPTKPIYTVQSEKQPKPKRKKTLLGLNKVKQRNKAVYEENNQNKPRNEIDLHGLHGDEVIGVVVQCICMAKQENFSHIDLITGRGNNSKDNKPVLKPAVENYLKSKDMKYEMPNPGMFRVILQQRY